MDDSSRSIVTRVLDKILKKQNFNILKYDFTNIKFTEGHVSRIKCNVRATVRKNGKTEILDLFVKDNEGTIHDIFTDGHLNEIKVYSKIVPFFNGNAEEYETDPIETIPHCYGVSSDGLLHHTVVLENLKSRGFKKRELVPLDLNHIKLVLKAFAEWHAHSFALEYRKWDEFRQIQEPKLGFGKFQTLDIVVTSYEKELDFAIGLYKKKNKPTVLEKLKSLRKDLRVMFKKYLKYVDYHVITHAQAWNDNFMFKYDEESIPTEVRIIDWQTSILGSPVLDIAQIFFFCCSREDLENIHDLLELYHSILSKKIRQLRGKPEDVNFCFPWEACLSTFRKYAPLAIAGVPIIMRMQFKDSLKAPAERPKHFSSFDHEAYFERMNSILELCIEYNFI